MTRRWGRATRTTAFRAEPATTPAVRPTARQSVGILAVLALVIGTVVSLSYLVKPDRARAFDLLHGSIFLADQYGPVAVDLPSGRPTLQLVNIGKLVGVRNLTNLSVVPAQDATVLLDRNTGQFNMAANTGFVVKRNGGVSLPSGHESTTSSSAAYPTGDPSDPGQAYIVRFSSRRTEAFLVDEGTVQRSVPGTPTVPQASLTSAFPTRAYAGGVVSAGGNLWLLEADADGGSTIHELRVPANRTREGLTLSDHRRGKVHGAAALAVTTSGGDAAVAVASTDGLRIYRPDGTTRDVRINGMAGATKILPVSETLGHFTFLVQSHTAWSIVSVAVDGTADAALTRIPDVDQAADLAPPSMSGGGVFTVDRRNGRIYDIGTDGRLTDIDGITKYPVSKSDFADFKDTYVVAEGSRVFVDSPLHIDAVSIFTDNAPTAHEFGKNTAPVVVSAATGAEALTRGTPVDGGRSKQSIPKVKPKLPGTTIDNNVVCSKSVQQKPHAATGLKVEQTGSRSVRLSWSYALVTRQECVPSQYEIYVRSEDDGSTRVAPVLSTTEATVTGLQPLTRYSVRVRAALNGVLGPLSAERRFTTEAQGPVAPVGVTAVADDAGNWSLHWRQGCVGNGCAAVSTWTITPTTCDNRGIANLRPAVAPADPTVIDQSAKFTGGDTLLGRGLQFTVTGTGTALQGAREGSPSGKTACVYSHAPADPGALKLTASTPSSAAFGHEVAAKVSLDLGSNPVHALGGVGADVTFFLTGGGSTKQQTVVFDGQQTTMVATFSGVRAGASYQASVTVTPPSGGVPASVQSAPVSIRSEWPAVGLTATCTPTSAVACQLHVGVTGISSATADGEFFDFAGALTCAHGSVQTGISRSHFDPADTASDPISVDASQADGLFGPCSVSGTLQESASDTHLFGGLPLKVTTDVDLGAPLLGGATAADFQASFVDHGGSAVEVVYTGSNAYLGSVTSGWSETISPPSGTDCSDPAQSQVPGADAATAVYVPVSASCVAEYGDPTQGDLTWTVTILYTNIATGDQQTVPVLLTGHPVGYQPCAPAAGFAESWDTPATDGVTVTWNGDPAQLGGCTGFTYQLIAPDGTVTDTASDVDPTNAVPLSVGSATPGPGWTVHIAWHDNDTGQDEALSPDPGLPDPP